MDADYGLGSWPARRARIGPDVVALRQGERALTYAELAERVERLADGLAARGVGPGDRVAYLGPNDIATFEVFFAAGRLGAIFAPFNTRLAPPEIGYLLDDCAPTVLVYAAELNELVTAVDPAAHGVPTTVEVGDGYDTLLTGAPPRRRAEPVALSDDAVILYTSGTTGRPKGAVLSHANLTFNTMNQLAHADVLSTDTALCIAPLFHATGLGMVSLPTLFKGGTVQVVPRFEPGAVLAAIAAHRVASFSCVPTMLALLCDHPDFGRTDLGSLRYVVYGGSSVAERVAMAWQERGVTLQQGYGMTEASPGVCMAPLAGSTQRPVSVGVPQFYTDITFDPELDEPERGGRGELLVRGLNVSRGYWNRPADTERAFDRGWYRTGDIVRVERDGWAYVVDRVRDMIISGGENVYPAEVEAEVTALPGVLACSVVAVPDERWGEVGRAFVVADPVVADPVVADPVVADPVRWTEQTLRAALTGRLATFKIPKYVTFVDELPRTATGKVRKDLLRAAVPHS
ncbi:MAG TPA: long-chain fatty acid--CoA ligase [Pseudonocardia sp.]|nr:long-chain fatty acid--CoA ligase [Pseudonocardia sp.]